MTTDINKLFQISAVIIVFMLIIFSLRGCIDWEKANKSHEKVFVEVPVLVAPHKEVIHDTVPGKARKIETIIPIDLTDTVKIKQLLFSLDSLKDLLVAKKVDRLEQYDTTFSAYGDTIKDNLHLEYYLLTSRKSITLDIKQREFKRVIEQIPIPIKKSNFIEQIISDYPLAAVGIGAVGAFVLGRQ